MPKTKISEWSSTPANNTDIDSINIAEGCAPSGINDAIRELMSQVKDLYAGTSGDLIAVAGGGTGVGTLTGIVKGNGTSAFSAATAGTDYVTPTGAETLTNKTLTAPVIDNPKMGYTTTATAAGTTTLTVTSNHQQFFTGTTTQTIVLPVTSTLALGMSYSIENNSTGVLTVQSSGANTITTIPAGVTTLFTCILTSGTTAASWDYDQIGFATITGTGANVLGTAPTIASANLTTALTLTGAAGTSGQVLTSGGSGAAPTWTTVSGGGASSATPTVEGTVYGKMTASGGTPFLTALGYNAGLNNTGVSNSAVGWEALKANTSGTLNTALGYQAGASNVSANRLTAVGYQAGLNSTAASNSFFGAYAGNQISTGIANTGIGDNALGNAANTGSYNTALGQGALANISNSSNSVGVGYLAGNLITTGGKNTIIGGYNGNQDGLDIRTASSYAIIADGDGNRQITTKEGQTLALDSAVPNSGTGITFPATQSASTDANTLDDYEEGTWSPTITSGTGSFTTVSAVNGVYTKIGNIITCSVAVNIGNAGTAGGGIVVTFPFSAATAGSYAGSASEYNATGVSCSLYVNSASDFIVAKYDATTIIATGRVIGISITYKAAA